MGSSRVTIPRAFSWLLPAQGFVAAVIIYSAIYVFLVGSIPFILSVVAAGLHFLLGLYICFTGNRPGSYHLFIVPIWLVVAAGVWAGTVYYFAAQLDLILKLNLVDAGFESIGKPLYTTWVKVGTATAALNVVLDFVMLGFFIHGAMHQTSQPTSVISAPIQSQTQPYVSAQQNQQYPQTQQYQQPQQQYQQQQYQTQQYQQYQTPSQYPYPYSQQQQQQRTGPIHPVSIIPSSPPSTSDYKPTSSPSPPTLPISISPVSHTTTPPHRASNVYPYDRRNRIDVIRRLCALQHPDGHWDYSDELAELVKLWGGRDLMAPQHGVTALTQACLMDLCNYVWAAQRDGREHEALNAAELMSLQGVNWDLGWAKNAADRAGGWLGGGYR